MGTNTGIVSITLAVCWILFLVICILCSIKRANRLLLANFRTCALGNCYWRTFIVLAAVAYMCSPSDHPACIGQLTEEGTCRTSKRFQQGKSPKELDNKGRGMENKELEKVEKRLKNVEKQLENMEKQLENMAKQLELMTKQLELIVKQLEKKKEK